MIEAKTIISVPLYNEEKYIDATLKSLHDVPEGPDVLFYISDNQSTDKSFEIVQSYAEKDKRFVVHQHETNVGAAENFNHVFNHSRSDYFMWLGGHDVIDSAYVAAAIKILDAHGDACYAAGEPYAFMDNMENSKPMDAAKYEFHEHRLVRYLQSIGQLTNCTVVNSMFRRSFLDDFEFRTTISNDHVLISHLLWHGKIYYAQGQKYYRRFFENEATRGSRDERITASKDVKLNRHDFFQYYIDDFKNLYDGPSEMRDHLCHKIMAMLEKRFGLLGFDTLGD